MTNKITSMLSRLAAPFLKPTLAILAALAVGGAWAAYDQIWTGETATDGKYYWSDNWKDGTGEWGNYVIGTETPNAVVNFTGEPNSATYLFLENNSKVLFQADSSTAGLETSGKLTIGTGVQPSELIISNGVYDVHGDIAIAATKAGSLTIADGAVVTCKGADDSVRWVVFGVWSESGTEGGTSDCSINLDAGGSLEAFHIHRYTTAGSCVVSFNGGKLKALGNTDDFITSTVTVTVGSNGGTIDVGANTVTNAALVTGSGTISKMGSGTLTFTGDMSGFVGRIAVASDAGSVTLPATATRARAGDYTAVTENQDGTRTFAYDANGSAAAAATVTLLNLDFEDETNYADGWTFSDYSSAKSSYANSSRTLVQKYDNDEYMVSKFLKVTSVTGGSGNRGIKCTRDMGTAFAAESSYMLELDWFATANYRYNANESSNDLGLYLISGNATIVKLTSNPEWVNDRNVRIYLNGASTPESVTLQAATLGASCDESNNQDKWYHIILKANQADGVTLTILNNDLTTVAFPETRVCDFLTVDKIVLDINRHRGGNDAVAMGGVDDILVSVPAVASVDGTNYKSFASAVAAATSSSTITLYGDVELTSSVELPYGVTLNLNGNVLYTTDDSVAVTFDDGAHYLSSTTEGGVKTFNETVLVYDTVCLWTAGGTPNADGSYNWSDSDNWTSLPTEAKDVVFPATDAEGGWKVVLDAAKTVAKITFNGNATLTGALIYARTVDGASDAVVTLGNDAGFGTYRELNAALDVSVSLNVMGGNDHPNKLDGYYTTKSGKPDQGGTAINFSGDLTGSGYLKIIGCRAHDTMSGDWSDFSGTVDIFDDKVARHEVNLTGSCIGSAKAKWIAYTDNRKAFAHAGSTVYFGSLSGYVYQAISYYDKVFEIGALNEPCSFGGAIGSSGVNNIKKVGTASLEFTGSKLGSADIQNGTFIVGGTDSMPTTAITFTGNGVLKVSAKNANDEFLDPSAVLKNSSHYPIVFDSDNGNHTWATSIAASNTKGLKKIGAGMLTLSYAPEYAGFEITVAENGGSVVLPKDANVTLGDYTIASEKTDTTKTLVYAATVNVTGLAHEHATATVTAGGETVTVTEGVAAVPVGSNVVITWTPAAGYQIDAGETQELSDIREAKVANAPTVSLLPTVAIAAPVVGAYGNDFATVSVTAGVTSTYPAATTITYTLKANGTVIATKTAAGDATSVTFNNADVSSLTRYGNISYTVEASGESVTAATSGATTAMLADSERWVDEKKLTSGTTGSWKTADGAAATVTYDNETERAELSDNKFSANNCSTGDVVTVTIKDVIYTALSDTSAVDSDAQGSIALGGTESAPTFMVLTKSGNEVQWSVAAGVDPALNTSYTIVFTFDYNNNTYSITVNGTALTVGGSSTYGIVKTDNKYVKDIDFLGAGSIKAIEGVQYDAMMAVDQNGDRYATVAEALDANKSVKGAIIKLLHGTSNTSVAGWSYNADTMTFIRKAIGLIFLAF